MYSISKPKHTIPLVDNNYPDYLFQIEKLHSKLLFGAKDNLTCPVWVYFKKHNPTMILALDVGSILSLQKKNGEFQVIVQIESIAFSPNGRKAVLEVKLA